MDVGAAADDGVSSSMRKVHLLSGAIVEVKDSPELRAFKLALSTELGHPTFLLTLLCNGAAVTCDGEWQKLESSAHLVAVRSCPFSDCTADFDQDLTEATPQGLLNRRPGSKGFSCACC